MKPTQLTELLANIRKTFVSFFSILMFVALGVGIFLGISWASPALQNAAEGVFDDGAFHDLQIQFPYGLTDEDLNELVAVEGVSEVEPVRQSFQEFVIGDKKVAVKVQALGERIDVPLVVEGALPAETDEIALNAAAASKFGVRVGDSVEFERDSEGDANASAIDFASSADGAGGADDDNAEEQPDDGMRYLNGAAYKVTAIVNSPEYLAKSSATYGSSPTASGSVDMIAWFTAAAFDGAAFQDGYPIVNVRCGSLADAGTFSDEYAQASAAVETRVSELGGRLADERYQQLHDQAQERVDEGERQLADAEEQIAQGEQAVSDGTQQLEEARTTFEQKRAEGERRLAAAYQQLMGYEAQKAEAEQLLAQATELYEQTKEAIKGMDDDEEISAAGQKTTVAEIKKMLPRAKKEMDAKTAEFEELKAKLVDGWNQYYAGWAELESQSAQAERQIADGEARIAEVEQQVADGKERVAEEKPKLEEAKEQVASMKDYDWTVMPRSYNAGVVQVSMFSDVTDNLSFSMAALFVIVGLLVSYSAVSRIVHEQITQIGTKKALGLREREITASFLAYSALAVLAGAVIGTIVGVTLVEGIIGRVLGDMFVMGGYPPYFGWPLFLAVTALELVLVLGATWLACHSILREHAVELLKGEKPPEAKTRFYEKWALWDRLPLFTQTIVNNCVNDKRRVFSTIVGVAGCTALIVTAITLNDDVLASYDRQYQNVYSFNAIAYVDTSTEGAADSVETTMQDAGTSTAQALRKSFVLQQSDGGLATARVIVPESADSFDRVYHVNPVQGVPLDLSADGAWVSQAYADHLGAKAGDELVVDAGDGVERRVPILGFYEFWLTNHEMVMGRDYYERAFDVEFAPNVVLADTGESAVPDVETMLAGTPGFGSIADDKASQGGNFQQFASVSRAVVLIYLALSVLMAVVVLLNLNVMFIEEKKRELIVLMINGFSVRDAKRYIYNDTIVLTAIGIVCGEVLGCVMGAVTVGSVEPSTATFVKDIDWLAVAAGIVGSAVLAFVMSMVALRRIPRFALTDINKF